MQADRNLEAGSYLKRANTRFAPTIMYLFAAGLNRPDLILWKMVEILQILVPSTRLLVDFEILKADKIHRESLDLNGFTPAVAIPKRNAGGARNDFDADRRNTHPYNLVRFKKERFCHALSSYAERTECSGCLLCVVFTDSNPDIQVSCRAGVSMVADSISANDEILNLLSVQKSQEVSEVGM